MENGYVRSYCSTSEVYLYVHSCPERDQARKETLDSLEESDAAGRVLLERQPEEAIPFAFHLQALGRALASCQAPDGPRLIVRLEDDVLVSEHLLHNLTTWPALWEPDFGVGWLFLPTAVEGADNDMVGRGPVSGEQRWLGPRLCSSLGQVWRADDFPDFLSALRRNPDVIHNAAKHSSPPNCAFDLTTSMTTWAMGRYVYLHRPPLVDFGQASEKSVVGHQHGSVLSVPYARHWRR